MSLHDSSANSATPANAVTLVDITTHDTWTHYVATLLTKSSLGHCASTYPYFDGPEAERLDIANVPISEPVDDTLETIALVQSRE